MLAKPTRIAGREHPNLDLAAGRRRDQLRHGRPPAGERLAQDGRPDVDPSASATCPAVAELSSRARISTLSGVVAIVATKGRSAKWRATPVETTTSAAGGMVPARLRTSPAAAGEVTRAARCRSQTFC